MSKKQKVDRRVRRTRALLQNSLLDLLQKKRLAKIQIKEITEHADLSRQAFYLHFDSKEELLFSYLDDVFAQIHQVIERHLKTQLTIEAFAVATYRNLPSCHPVYKLLLPHLRYTIGINVLGKLIMKNEENKSLNENIYLNINIKSNL